MQTMKTMQTMQTMQTIQTIQTIQTMQTIKSRQCRQCRKYRICRQCRLCRLSRIRAIWGLICPDFYSDIEDFTQILCRYLPKKLAAKTSGVVALLKTYFRYPICHVQTVLESPSKASKCSAEIYFRDLIFFRHEEDIGTNAATPHHAAGLWQSLQLRQCLCGEGQGRP